MKLFPYVVISSVFVCSTVLAENLKQVTDRLDIQTGVNVENIYCAKQLKPRALESLSNVDKTACGFGAADSVYRAIQTMPIERLPELEGVAYTTLKMSRSSQCQASSAQLKNAVATVQTKSHKDCQNLGHASCNDVAPTTEYTSDHYCVVVGHSQGVGSAGMSADITKILEARSLLEKALNLYHLFPCDSAQAGALITQAQKLIESTKSWTFDPNDPIAQMNMCTLLN